MRDWVTNVETTNYIFGTVAGPHPFPEMVRDFQKIIGEEARAQVLELTGALPTAVAACVGGGSNAIGIFHAFLDDAEVGLYGFEAAGEGVDTDRHAATITKGRPGVLHGARSYLLQDDDGQTIESHSISAGLDYPGVGPEHSWLAAIGRAEYRPVTDAAAMEALRLLTRTEGIIPAIESAHALAGRARARSRARPRRDDPREPLGPRRQGHGHGRASTSTSTTRRPRNEDGRAPVIARRNDEASGALIGYLPVGFPDFDESIDAAVAIVENGVDVLELGLPYSDPVMDGPVIQAATQQALANGFRIADGFEAVRRITERVDAPVLIMTYWNPVRAVRRRPLRR